MGACRVRLTARHYLAYRQIIRERDRPMNETELERVRELVRISGEMITDEMTGILISSNRSFYFDDVAWLVGVVEELAEMLGVSI